MSGSSAAAMLRRVARETRSLPRTTIEDDVVKPFTKAITDELRHDTGGDFRLSGAPTRMRVQSKVDGHTVVTAVISPNPQAMAQWDWLEDGTGEPGPTRPKGTWHEPVAEAMAHVLAAVRRRFETVTR